MIRCPKCGNMMPPGARFCGICAQPLTPPSAAVPDSSLAATGLGPAQPPPLDPSALPKPGMPVQAPMVPYVPHQASLPAVPPPAAPVPFARRRGPARKIAALVLLVVVVVGALGAGYIITRSPTHATSTSSTATTATATSQVATASGSPPTLTFNSPASADMDGLHIQTDGLWCPYQLVLKQPQATYDDTALQQMRTYLTPLTQKTDYGFNNYPYDGGAFFVLYPETAKTLPPVPDSLQWVPGGRGSGPIGGNAECLGEFDFTNTGTASIQIKSIDFTYDANSIANNFANGLVDTCSVVPPTSNPPCAPEGQSGGGPCYSATFHLQQDAAGTQIPGPIEVTGGSSDKPCPPTLTLERVMHFLGRQHTSGLTGMDC